MCASGFCTRLACAEAIHVRTAQPRLVCTAADSYCKIALKISYTYPPHVTQARDAVPVECIAKIAIRDAANRTETVENYRSLMNAAVSHGAIEEEVELKVKPPAKATSIELKSVGCTLSSL